MSAPRQLGEKKGLVDEREVLHDVAAPRAGLNLPHRVVRALSLAVGIAASSEARLEQRLDLLAQRTMQHPVVEGCGVDAVQLGLSDVSSCRRGRARPGL